MEPARRIELRWGRYEARYGVGLGLMIAATVVAQLLVRIGPPASAIGALALVVAGVVVLPALPSRRLLAIGILLVVYLPPPALGRFLVNNWWEVVAVLVVLLWLILRERSGLTYAIVLPLTALLQLLVLGLLYWTGYDDFRPASIHWLVLGLLLFLLVPAAAAWLARALEPRLGARRELAGSKV